MKLHYFIYNVEALPPDDRERVKRLCPSLPLHWWNGYVCLPAGHPCHSMTFTEIEKVFDIKVYRGLSFSASVKDKAGWSPLESEKVNADDWIVGFDTAGFFNQNCDSKFVRKEARNLARQFEVIYDAFEAVDWRKYL